MNPTIVIINSLQHVIKQRAVIEIIMWFLNHQDALAHDNCSFSVDLRGKALSIKPSYIENITVPG